MLYVNCTLYFVGRVQSNLFPVASVLLIGSLTVTSFTLNRAGQNAQTVISSVICAGATAGMMALVKANGRQICSRPRLCGLL
ncbi:putative phosphatidylinositol-3,4-bisphosphate 4-phosphatase [Helianthus anomalus]